MLLVKNKFFKKILFVFIILLLLFTSKTFSIGLDYSPSFSVIGINIELPFSIYFHGSSSTKVLTGESKGVVDEIYIIDGGISKDLIILDLPLFLNVKLGIGYMYSDMTFFGNNYKDNIYGCTIKSSFNFGKSDLISFGFYCALYMSFYINEFKNGIECNLYNNYKFYPEIGITFDIF